MRDRDALANLISAENGKALVDAIAEVTYSADFFRWFSEEVCRPQSSWTTAPAGGARSLVTHKPISVAALVCPWNFPAAMITRKVGAALAAGSTMVVKPAAETPLTALALQSILTEAGVPDGVVNIVPTTDPATVVGTWLTDERVRKLSFTGSTQVGRALLAQAADRVINCSMELGGNAPFIVMPDADIDAAVQGLMIAKFRSGGQACTAANRIFVHDAVAEDFTYRFVRAVAGLKVGPASTGADIGAMISGRAIARINRTIDDAVSEGATIAYQATNLPGTGYFAAPTVLTDIEPRFRILSQEIFGPVAPIITWSDRNEMLEVVNDIELGLAAYVYTGDLRHGLDIAERIEAGMVGLNLGVVSDPSAPFGGVKESGLGREGAQAGIAAFQEPHYIRVAW
jgi:succinate-semialdehyde dehydrogenase/glutarate-semialdehyde dehydrogenase